MRTRSGPTPLQMDGGPFSQEAQTPPDGTRESAYRNFFKHPVVRTVWLIALASLIVLVLAERYQIVPKHKTVRLTHDRVLALVLGLTRESDGLTYGEFAKKRFLHESCPAADPSKFEYLVRASGNTDDPFLRVTMYDPEESPPSCAGNGRSRTATLAGIQASVGRVVAVEGMDSDDKPQWFRDFVSGAAP